MGKQASRPDAVSLLFAFLFITVRFHYPVPDLLELYCFTEAFKQLVLLASNRLAELGCQGFARPERATLAHKQSLDFSDLTLL